MYSKQQKESPEGAVEWKEVKTQYDAEKQQAYAAKAVNGSCDE